MSDRHLPSTRLGDPEACHVCASVSPIRDGGLLRQTVGRLPKPMKIVLSHFIKNVKTHHSFACKDLVVRSSPTGDPK